MLKSSYNTQSSAVKYAKVRYHFVARNSNELSVQQGEKLEVIEDDKQWLLLRNRSGVSGYVPCNVLELLKPEDTQGLAGPLSSQPGKPSRGPSTSLSLGRGESSEMGRSLQDKDNRTQQMEVNDELLKRIADKSQPPARNFRVERPSGTPLPLTFDSQPHQITSWLSAKGFSKPVVDCLGILTGAQLFSLNKEELKAVCGDEGSRVYSQISVQKAQLEKSHGASELQEIMRRRQEEIDASTWH